MKQIEKSSRKLLNNVPHFLHACTLLMYEIHALKRVAHYSSVYGDIYVLIKTVINIWQIRRCDITLF